MRLARERIANRRRRKEQGEEDPVEPEEHALPEPGMVRDGRGGICIN